ncbi:hypothetical protein MRX96_044266 [Rhipicephalus microplus]
MPEDGAAREVKRTISATKAKPGNVHNSRLSTMISTTKIRRPPSVIPNERRKLRRVSFLESSTADVTESTIGDVSESIIWKARDEPQPTRLNDAKYDFRLSSDKSKSRIRPSAASASRLFQGSQQPSHVTLAPGRSPVMTAILQRSPPSPPPPSRNDQVYVFDPVSKVCQTRREDRDDRDGSEQPCLQNFGIGVLVAALVAAVLTLALTADRPTAQVNRKEVSPLLRELEEFAAAGGNKIVQSIEARRAAARIGTKVMTMRRKVLLATASTSLKTKTKTQPASRLHTENQTVVGAVAVSTRTCEQERREAYYDDRSQSCAWSERDRVRVCNRGANRFPNLGTCLDSCARDPPRERCFESVLLTDCSRRDVVEKWWFFDGSRCVHWDFPMGDCPSSRGGRTFRSLRECSLTCLYHRHFGRRQRLDGAPVPQRSRCHAPLAVTCDSRDIRFPYFADMNARGSARCVKTSTPTLLSRLCLVGSNRFDSLSTCKEVCGNSPREVP